MKSSTKELLFEIFMILTTPFWGIVGLILFGVLFPIYIICTIIKYSIKLFSPDSADRIDLLVKNFFVGIIEFFSNLKDYTREFLFNCWEWLKKALMVILAIIAFFGFIYMNFKSCEGSGNHYDEEYFDDAHRPDRF